MEDVNKRTRNLLSHSELGYGSGEFNSRRVRLHLAKPAQFKRPAFHVPKFIASWVDPSDISSNSIHFHDAQWSTMLTTGNKLLIVIYAYGS